MTFAALSSGSRTCGYASMHIGITLGCPHCFGYPVSTLPKASFGNTARSQRRNHREGKNLPLVSVVFLRGCPLHFSFVRVLYYCNLQSKGYQCRILFGQPLPDVHDSSAFLDDGILDAFPLLSFLSEYLHHNFWSWLSYSRPTHTNCSHGNLWRKFQSPNTDLQKRQPRPDHSWNVSFVQTPL